MRINFGRLEVSEQVSALTELGEGTQNTRPRATLDELVRRPDDKSAARPVLRVLADARLVTLAAATAEVAPARGLSGGCTREAAEGGSLPAEGGESWPSKDRVW